MMSNSKPVSFENKDKYVELGLNIAFYRKHAGLTQEELAERAGISRSHLSAIEAPTSSVPSRWKFCSTSPQPWASRPAACWSSDKALNCLIWKIGKYGIHD